MSKYYKLEDRKVVPATQEEWLSTLRDPAYERVCATSVPGYWVSTVFLGMNHQWDDGPPLVFETMIFPEDDDGQRSWDEQYMARYSTWEEAEAGHAKAVEIAKTGKFNEEE